LERLMMTLADKPQKSSGEAAFSPFAARNIAVAYLSEGFTSAWVRDETAGDGEYLAMFSAIASAMDALTAEGITPDAAAALLREPEAAR
jgi:hypothetical protein